MQEIARIRCSSHEIEMSGAADDLRFACLRCGRLCCRLGGPMLTENDIDALKRALPDKHKNVIDATRTSDRTMLSSKPTGECIFLDNERGKGKCMIYEHRPNVCRLFPFAFSKDEDYIRLFALPCRGLNKRAGTLIDSEFVRGLLASSDLFK